MPALHSDCNDHALRSHSARNTFETRSSSASVGQNAAAASPQRQKASPPQKRPLGQGKTLGLGAQVEDQVPLGMQNCQPQSWHLR